MASRYFINGGTNSNWNNTGNWSNSSGGPGGQTVPTSADDVFFTGASPNCTVDTATAACKTLAFTSGGSDYTNVITMTNNITVGQAANAFSGNITLHAGMTTANATGSGALINNIAGNTPTLTSNGGVWGADYRIGSTVTVTLSAAGWSVNNFQVLTAGSTMNSNSMTIRGNMTISATLAGGSTLIIGGTGAQTWSSSGGAYIGVPLTINKPSGTLTITGTVYYGATTTPFFQYIASGGTISVGTSTLYIGSGASLNIGGINWYNLTFAGAAANPATLGQSITVTNLLTIGAQAVNGSTITVNGSLTGNASGTSGTTNIIMDGTGTLAASSTGIKNNLTINTSGTITIGTFFFSTKTFTHTNGTLDVSASSITFDTATINCTIYLGNVTFLGACTLSSNMIVNNFVGGAGGGSLSGNSISVLGNLTIGNGAISGTTTLTINGTVDQTYSHGTANQYLSLPTTINKSSGVFIISGIIYFNGTFTISAGDVQTIGSTFTSNAATTYTMNGVKLWNATLGGTSITFTFNGDMYMDGLLTLNGVTGTTLNGNKLYVNSINHTGSAQIIGASEIVFYGNTIGSWTNATAALHQINTTINCGRLVLGSRVNFSNATLTYIRGYVDAFTNKNTFYLNNTTGTLINCNQINFNNIIITQNSVITMNEFFSGSPLKVTNISSSTAVNYTILFSDKLQKYSKHIKITNCNVYTTTTDKISKGQLIVITDNKKSSTNVGLRYYNAFPNNAPIDKPSVNIPAFVAGLVSDPAMEKY